LSKNIHPADIVKIKLLSFSCRCRKFGAGRKAHGEAGRKNDDKKLIDLSIN
jgi:hypothetical protein